MQRYLNHLLDLGLPGILSQVASVHGLRYIFEERLPSSDRILWTAAVLLGLLLSGTMVVQVCRNDI